MNGRLIDRKVPWSPVRGASAAGTRATVRSRPRNSSATSNDTQELINKFRAKKNKAAFAQSLITKLDKLDRIEVDDVDLRKLLVRFPPAPRAARSIAELHDVAKAYGARRIFSHAELTIARGSTWPWSAQTAPVRAP